MFEAKCCFEIINEYIIMVVEESIHEANGTIVSLKLFDSKMLI